MNTIHHHPEDASLTSYTAGALPAALALVVGCHLEYCARCRAVVAQAESIGGALMDQLTPQPMKAGAGAAMLARLDRLDRLDRESSVASVASTPVARPIVESKEKIPAKLQRVLGDAQLSTQAWRSAGPGVRVLSLDCKEGNLILLDIAPGHTVPVHTHRGTELTLILDGHYDDKLGHFASGDIADLDGRVEHQPRAGDQGCLCLAGLDAPVRYKALIPRLLQPFFRL
jgi:putative transcriptional regulator